MCVTSRRTTSRTTGGVTRLCLPRRVHESQLVACEYNIERTNTLGAARRNVTYHRYKAGVPRVSLGSWLGIPSRCRQDGYAPIRAPMRINAVIMAPTVSMLCSQTAPASTGARELKDSSLNFLAYGFFMGWFSELTASHITVGVFIQYMVSQTNRSERHLELSFSTCLATVLLSLR